MTASGWEMVSEGTSGAQMKKAKEMSTAAKICIGVGIPGLFLAGLGIILILAGVLEYALSKEPTHFLSRTNPTYPTKMKKPGGFRII